MTEFERNFLLECLHKKFAEDEIEFATTVLAHGVKIRNRNLEVEKKLKEFAEAKLVVTDRLHGMVFAALTGTPCVAVGNCNGKVKGVYEWIKELPYVVYLDNILKIEEALDEINLEKSYTYEYGLVECKFELLFEQLKNIDKRGIEKDGEKFSNS